MVSSLCTQRTHPNPLPRPNPLFRSQQNKTKTNKRHFNAIATHFVDTLKELKVDQKYIDESVAVVLTTKDAILKTGAYAGKA